MSRLFLGFFGFVSFVGAIFGRFIVEAVRYVAPPLDLHLIPPIGWDDHSIAYRTSNQVGQNWRNASRVDPALT